ncbi:MAG TPA: iron uptake system protein EfeO [Cryobacterium sp.]|nr:iron uptake system protein EfeO [Cryobacterium sp.]
MRARLALFTTVSAALLALTGCVATGTTPDATHAALTVVSTATECTVSGHEAPAGTVRFTVTNKGEQVTEFYLLGADKKKIVGEAENIGPGLSRDLVVQLAAGTYFTACKPGMTGDGVGKATFTVTKSGAAGGPSTDLAARITSANTGYAAYVKEQLGQLSVGTQAFAAAYTAGDDALARSRYAPTRAHWERVETIAESFGDLDPKLDLREADLEPGQEWTGWHAIEKDLWPADAPAGFQAYGADKRRHLAGLLVADTATLRGKVQDLTFTLSQQTNGAIGLLDEVATKKVTGEEESWSHTDLWDFQANVDGAATLYAGVRSILVETDPQLAAALDREFASLQALLDSHRVGDGFARYTDLSGAEVKALSDQVNALGEPLNRLTAALVL